MKPSYQIVDHLHALWLEQRKRRGVIFLQGQLTPDEDAATRSVIAQSETRIVANVLSIQLSTTCLVTLKTTCGRVDAASVYVGMCYGSAVQYGSCITRDHANETFLIESALAFRAGDGEPLSRLPGQHWIGIEPEQFASLLAQGQEIGESLLPVHRPLADAVCAARGYEYGDPERYLWVDLQVDIPLSDAGELDLDSARIRVDSNQYSHWSTALVSLRGELDPSSIVTTIFAEG